MTLCGIVWLYLALYGIIRPFLPYMASYVTTCSYMIFFMFFLWSNIDFIGIVSSFLAVKDPNSFGLCFLLVLVVPIWQPFFEVNVGLSIIITYKVIIIVDQMISIIKDWSMHNSIDKISINHVILLRPNYCWTL